MNPHPVGRRPTRIWRGPRHNPAHRPFGCGGECVTTPGLSCPGWGDRDRSLAAQPPQVGVQHRGGESAPADRRRRATTDHRSGSLPVDRNHPRSVSRARWGTRRRFPNPGPTPVARPTHRAEEPHIWGMSGGVGEEQLGRCRHSGRDPRAPVRRSAKLGRSRSTSALLEFRRPELGYRPGNLRSTSTGPRGTR
jgi:hypothetical protein